MSHTTSQPWYALTVKDDHKHIWPTASCWPVDRPSLSETEQGTGRRIFITYHAESWSGDSEGDTKEDNEGYCIYWNHTMYGVSAIHHRMVLNTVPDWRKLCAALFVYSLSPYNCTGLRPNFFQNLSSSEGTELNFKCGFTLLRAVKFSTTIIHVIASSMFPFTSSFSLT